MLRRFAVVVCLLAGACAAAPAAREPLAARADALLSALHARGEFDGAAVIGRDGKVLYARGFGAANAEAGLAFTPDTPTDGGSLAKPVTAAAVLLLAQEGRVDLDAPAARYAAEFPHPQTTLRQLLSHTAGLPDYDAFQALLDAGAPVSTPDLLRALAARRTPPAFEPGTAFAYCSLCHDALALVVERVSGQPYERFVHERLLRPAGATRTFLRPARLADWPGVRTRGYRRTEGRLAAFDALDNEGFYGGSNLYFTANDLHAWSAAWARARLPPPAVRAKALAPARIDGGASGLTLGNWYCAPRGRRCWYPGHHQGFHNFAYWDADRRLSVVFVSNNTLAAPLQPGLARALIALAENRDPGPLPAAGHPDHPFDSAAAAGSYRLPELGLVVVEAEGGRARVRLGRGPAYALFPVGSGMLYAPGLDAYLTFADLRQGVYRRLRWTSVPYDVSAERL